MVSFKILGPFCCLFAAIFYGCNKSDNLSIDKNRVLYEKYGGDYRLETSYADRAVDIDLNGTKNTDMLKESLDFRSSKLWISIDKNLLLFEQMWPEQYPYFDEGKLLHVNFANQADTRTFEFAEHDTQIVTDTIAKTLNGVITKSPPLSVKIIGEGKIEVLNTKKLYTNNGWEEITFTSVYAYTGYNKGIFE